jgi:hypothetical protein
MLAGPERDAVAIVEAVERIEHAPDVGELVGAVRGVSARAPRSRAS